MGVRYDLIHIARFSFIFSLNFNSVQFRFLSYSANLFKLLILMLKEAGKLVIDLRVTGSRATYDESFLLNEENR